MPEKNPIKAIEKIVKIAYASAFLKDEKPLSLILIAPPEQSKSHYILKYQTKHSYISTDMSYLGLIRLLKNNNKIKHIVIPDFLKITQKNKNTKNAMLTTINSFLEEGIHKINLANEESIDLNGRSGGIITATTKTSFEQNKKVWEGIGFSSRFLICSWRYTDKKMKNLVRKILIEGSSTQKSKNSTKKLVFCPKTIAINRENSEKIALFAENSPRKAKNLRVFLKALCVINDKKEVGNEEISELLHLSKYLNLEFNWVDLDKNDENSEENKQ